MLKFVALSLIFVVSTLAAKIVGGGGADIKQHPYQVSVQLRQNDYSPFEHHCGGSIIKAFCILTAAHCVEKKRPQDLMIVAGSSKLSDANAVSVGVRKLLKHPSFNATSYEYDVALIYTAKHLTINQETINTIALATNAPQPGSWACATGWGDTSFGGHESNELLQVYVPIVNNKNCDASYTSIYNRSRITSDMICAGVGGKDSCQGDSGGPLTFNKTLFGVSSWGYKCGLANAPGVYANVPFLRQWIIKYI